LPRALSHRRVAGGVSDGAPVPGEPAVKAEREGHGNRTLRWLTCLIETGATAAGCTGCWPRSRATVAVALVLVGLSLGLLPTIGFSLFPEADTPIPGTLVPPW